MKARRLVVAPTGSGPGYVAEVRDHAGVPRASCDAAGALRNESRAVLLHAPLLELGRRSGPTDAGIEIADPDGRALGSARVISYTFAPRTRRITLSIRDAHGSEVARLQPSDRRGNRLVVTSGETRLAAIDVEQVRQGLLRTARVCTIDVEIELPAQLAPLVLTAAIRYDAVMGAATAASQRDD